MEGELGDLDEDEVELAEVQFSALKRPFVARIPNNHIHDVGLDELALVGREDFPSVLDALLKRGESKELALLALCALKNSVHTRPRLRMLLKLSHERVDLFPLGLVARRVHGVDHLETRPRVQFS